jgi:CheY-like chemotaxis protein
MASNGKTVIIADDHETLVMYLSVLMRRMGFNVIPARNGQEMLGVLTTILPDLIITDLKMPVMDGLAALKVIKKDRRFSDIPVIMVSAHFEQQAFDECMALGGAGFLTKPINLHALHQLLRECITYPNDMKRKNLRVVYGNKIMAGYAGRQLAYYAVTLSEQGIYLRTQNPLPVGTQMNVHLELQDGQTLAAQGEVIYHKHVFSDIGVLDPGMAIKFNGLSIRDAEALKAHIMHVLAGDLLEEQQEPVIVDQEVQLQPLQETLAGLKQEWRLN